MNKKMKILLTGASTLAGLIVAGVVLAASYPKDLQSSLRSTDGEQVKQPLHVVDPQSDGRQYLSSPSTRMEAMTTLAHMQTEIDSLNRDVSSLTSQNKALTSQQNTLSSEVSSLTSQNKALTSQKNTLSSEVSGLTSQNKALTSQQNALSSEVSALSKVPSDEEQTISVASNAEKSTGMIVAEFGSSDPAASNATFSEGAAWFIGDNEHILTAFHVINDGSTDPSQYDSNPPTNIEFELGSNVFTASVCGFNSTDDLAVLKLNKPATGIAPLSVATSNPAIGSTVLAIGSPLGIYDSVTKGIISSVNVENGVQYIQTDAAINPGNSGGPLVGYNNEVYGMADFIPEYVDDNGDTTMAEGMSEFVSWTAIRSFASQFVKVN